MDDNAPTEQIPPARPVETPVYQRRAVRIGTGAVLLAIVATALVTWGITYAVVSDHSHDHRMSAQHRDRGPMLRERPIMGTIATENGDAWTIDAMGGRTVTVNLTPTTTFGTKAQAQQKADMIVGDRVIVRGRTDGDTVTATQVVERPKP